MPLRLHQTDAGSGSATLIPHYIISLIPAPLHVEVVTAFGELCVHVVDIVAVRGSAKINFIQGTDTTKE
jgi:hypothetical protein